MAKPIPGQYGVVATPGFFGFLIRLGTFSRWNHAFIYIGKGQIVEANPKGVQVMPVSEYPNIAWNQHEPLTATQRLAIVDTATSFIGKPYDFTDIFILTFRCLGLKLPRFFFGNVSKHKGLICSELVAKAYKSAGIELVAKADNLVTPSDLAYRLIYQ